MCVCMCVCIYIYINKYIPHLYCLVYIYTYIYTYMYIYTYTYSLLAGPYQSIILFASRCREKQILAKKNTWCHVGRMHVYIYKYIYLNIYGKLSHPRLDGGWTLVSRSKIVPPRTREPRITATHMPLLPARATQTNVENG